MSAIALPKTFRFQAIHTFGSGITVDVSIKSVLQKFNSSGELVNDSEDTLATFTDIAHNTFTSASSFNNDATGEKWLSGDLKIAVSGISATPTGRLVIRLQASTDGGTTWPTDGEGDIVLDAEFTTTTSRDFQRTI